MTWSIVAREPGTGHLGIAVASRFLAVGALVPHIRRNAAVATQAFVNPLWGVEGVARLAAGEAGAAVLADFAARDAGQAQRQCHMIDAAGRIAAHTGAACIPWAGHVAGEGVSVAGNMLAGPRVIAATLAAWEGGAGLPFPERLLAAMRAGEAEGGDRRGRQAAAIRIHRGEDYPWVDLRADDDADPLAELERLLDVARERSLIYADALPTRENFSGVSDRTALDERLARLEAERAAEGRPSRSRATGD